MRKLMMVAAILGIAACEDSNEPTIRYSATMSGANERPNAVTTNGSGTFDATIDANNVLNYTVTFTGLTSNSNNGHIHGPIAATGNAPVGVLVNFNDPNNGRTITLGATSGTATGSIDLKLPLSATISADSLRKLFDNGKLYVNIHTVNNPGGEILGIITRQ